MGLFSNLFGNSESSKPNLRDILQSGAYLVDVRTPAEFAGGSVKGAVNIPLDVLSSKLKLFKDKKNIVVFCRSGARSGQAKMILEQSGFKNVFNGGPWDELARLVK